MHIKRDALDVFEHDLLEGLLPCSVALGGDDLMESVEGGGLLVHIDELLRTLERILWLLEGYRVHDKVLGESPFGTSVRFLSRDGSALKTSR
jgi:hypothetical protein